MDGTKQAGSAGASAQSSSVRTRAPALRRDAPVYTAMQQSLYQAVEPTRLGGPTMHCTLKGRLLLSSVTRRPRRPSAWLVPRMFSLTVQPGASTTSSPTSGRRRKSGLIGSGSASGKAVGTAAGTGVKAGAGASRLRMPQVGTGPV